MALHVEIVSPERVLYSGDGDMVVARAADGDIAFLPGHAPFIGVLRFNRFALFPRLVICRLLRREVVDRMLGNDVGQVAHQVDAPGSGVNQHLGLIDRRSRRRIAIGYRAVMG